MGLKVQNHTFVTIPSAASQHSALLDIQFPGIFPDKSINMSG